MAKTRPPESVEFCRQMVELVHARRDSTFLSREFGLARIAPEHRYSGRAAGITDRRDWFAKFERKSPR